MNRTLLLLLCVLPGSLSVHAQTNSAGTPQVPVIITRLDTTRDDIREVDGRSYHIGRSALWRELMGEMMECRSNVLVVRTFVWKEVYGPVPPAASLPTSGKPFNQAPAPPPMRPVIGQKKKYGGVVAIRNFPEAATVTSAQDISCRAMIVGTYSWQDSLIELYDRGLSHAAPDPGAKPPTQHGNPADKKP